MAAMFIGLRLVFSVVMSDPILGHTFISTGLQVRGVKSVVYLKWVCSVTFDSATL